MKVVCFDLDDTLYKEIDYLKEAYRLIATYICGDDWHKLYEQMIEWYKSGHNVFDMVCQFYPNIEKEDLLHKYRYDVHSLSLPDKTKDLLIDLTSSNIKLGLITDGREKTQQNKINALGLDYYFDDGMIIISETFGSEKPSTNNYLYFMDKFPDAAFMYVGDNPKKDFAGANTLGWETVCLLDDGRNIHKQDFSNISSVYLPKIKINSLSELLILTK